MIVMLILTLNVNGKFSICYLQVMFDSTTELQKELLMLIFYALSNLLGGIFYKSFVDGKKEEIVVR